MTVFRFVSWSSPAAGNAGRWAASIKMMRIFILFTILIVFLIGCIAQPSQTQVSVVNTIVSTPSRIVIRNTEAVNTVALSPVPSRTPLGIITSTPLKMIETFPGEEFHFGATPSSSQVGGINGVFFRKAGSEEACASNYNVFRFYDDGLVLDASVCDDESTGDFSKGVWPYMSEWFSREIVDETTGQGIYHIADKKIWFTTVAKYPSHTVVSDYLGTISKDQMILDRFTHPNGYQIKEHEAREKYVWFDIPKEQ
jgi:hypothetical protein